MLSKRFSYIHSPILQQHDITREYQHINRKNKIINDTCDIVLLESSKLWRPYGIYKFMLCTRNI